MYSDNAKTRQDVMLALGKRVHPDLPELSYVEVATAPVVIQQVDAGGIDLAILDGEATPEGGMGIAKQLKDEIEQGPPIVVLTGRRDDAWLASWSRAEAAVPHPIDPIRLQPNRARVAAHSGAVAVDPGPRHRGARPLGEAGQCRQLSLQASEIGSRALKLANRRWLPGRCVLRPADHPTGCG